MEKNRIKTRNRYFIGNIVLLSICALFFVLHAFNNIDITHLSIYLPMILLFIEAYVFLNTFRFLKLKTRKIVVKILVIFVSLATLITAFILIYERVTGYVFIYRYTYGFLLISFLIYPAILLIMLLLLNRKDSVTSVKTITILTSIFVCCLMFFHGVIGGLGQQPMRVQESVDENNTIYLTDSMWLHGVEREYKQVNTFFMEYVGVSNEW